MCFYMHAGHVNESPFLSIVIFNIYSIALCDQVSGVGDSFIYCEHMTSALEY